MVEPAGSLGDLVERPKSWARPRWCARCKDKRAEGSRKYCAACREEVDEEQRLKRNAPHGRNKYWGYDRQIGVFVLPGDCRLDITNSEKLWSIQCARQVWSARIMIPIRGPVSMLWIPKDDRRRFTESRWRHLGDLRGMLTLGPDPMLVLSTRAFLPGPRVLRRVGRCDVQISGDALAMMHVRTARGAIVGVDAAYELGSVVGLRFVLGRRLASEKRGRK